MNTFAEPSRNIRVAGSCDVIVAGGGPAGVMAAAAAARTGASVRLIESTGALGGIWTSGLMPHIIEHRQPGLLQEMIRQLQTHDSHGTGPGISGKDFDPEAVKYVLDKMCADAGVRVRLYPMICAAYTENGRIRAIVSESKSGREAWQAKVYVDCTGDGDLSYMAGCRYEMGKPETGECQPLSMIAEAVGYGNGSSPPFSIKDWAENKKWIYEKILSAGHTTSYDKPSFFLIRDGQICVMANHGYGYMGPDAQVLSDATARGRNEYMEIAEKLRALGGEWENFRIVATSPFIGIREGRRILGLYKVTRKDLETGSRHTDAVCRVSFHSDVHSTNAASGHGIEHKSFKTLPYDIPLRALIPAGISNLITAGRCISGDFYAHASYRVSGVAAILGEAAGTAAGICAIKNISPNEIDFGDIRKFMPYVPGGE